MNTFDLTEPTDSFVLHFGSEEKQINAFTFINSLRSLSDAMMEINRCVNQYEEIDIVIEAIGSGSFRTKIKTIRRVTNENIKIMTKSLVVTTLSTLLVSSMLHPNFEQNVKIDKDRVTITQGDNEIQITKEDFESSKKVADNDLINNSISNAFSALSRDDKVSSFGIGLDLDEKKLAIEIKRENFPSIQKNLLEEIVEEEVPLEETVQVNLHILKTVFERGNRKWEFVWNGHKISAPIKDDTFFDKIERREYQFAQGDSLIVELKINKEKDKLSGAIINKSYEVEKVIELKHKSTQLPLQLSRLDK